jgi:hypothetical protein
MLLQLLPPPGAPSPRAPPSHWVCALQQSGSGLAGELALTTVIHFTTLNLFRWPTLMDHRSSEWFQGKQVRTRSVTSENHDGVMCACAGG